MNYKKVYDALINKRIINPLKKLKTNDINYIYTEEHHIFPRALGGTNDRSNLVLLTVEEHFIAHDLLYHYYKEIGNLKGEKAMLKALVRLLNSYDGKNIKNTYANRLHAFQLRKQYSNQLQNSIRITNGIIDKVILKTEQIPDGYKLGSCSHSNKGKIYINNGKTNKMIYPFEKIPIGWIKGSINQNKNKNKICINNGAINKYINKDDELPEGFYFGHINKKQRIVSNTNKGKKYITDGTYNKCISKNENIPIGWRIGKTLKKEYKNQIHITNGIENKLVYNINDIPIGWRIGITRHSAKKFFITNGIENRKVLSDSDIPIGWHKGSTNLKIKIRNEKYLPLLREMYQQFITNGFNWTYILSIYNNDLTKNYRFFIGLCKKMLPEYLSSKQTIGIRKRGKYNLHKKDI